RVDLPGADEPDELLEVALLRPADVAERVVDARLLVVGVVAPRPVCARIPEVDLAVQEILGVDVELDVADQHHAALPPGDLHGRVDDLRRVRAGADHRGVDPVLASEIDDAALPAGFGRVNRQRGAGGGGQRVRLRVDVDPDDDASGCLRDAGA